MAGILPTPSPIRRNFTCENFKEPCGALINVVKNETSTGPYSLGNTLTYEVSVINYGRSSLRGCSLYESLSPIDIKHDPLDIFSGGVCLPAGWVTTVTYDYTITPGNVSDGFVTGVVCLSSEGLSAVDTDICSNQLSSESLSTNIQPSALCTSLKTDILQPPGVSVSKVVLNEQNVYALGDVITYQVTVSNPGQMILGNIKLTDTLTNIDIKSGQDLFIGGISLSGGGSLTTVYEYVVTNSDITTGTVSNSAIVTSTLPTIHDSVNDIEVEEPGNLRVVKYNSCNIYGNITDNPPVLAPPSGEIVQFSRADTEVAQYTVAISGTAITTNEWDEAVFNCWSPSAILKAGAAFDDYGTVGGVDFKSNNSCNTPGASITSTSVDTEVPVKRIGNRLAVDWTVINDEFCERHIYFSGTIEFRWSPRKYVGGDDIIYSVYIENNGSSDVTDIILRDDLQNIEVLQDASGLFNGNVTLAPGDDAGVRYRYKVSWSDVAAGNVTNTATVNSSIGTVTSNTVSIDVQPSTDSQYIFNINTDRGSGDQHVFITASNETSIPFAQIKDAYLDLRNQPGMYDAPFHILIPARGWYTLSAAEVIEEDDPRPDSDDNAFWGYQGPFRIPSEFRNNPNSSVVELLSTDSELNSLDDQDLFTILGLDTAKPGTIIWIQEDTTGYDRSVGWNNVFLQWHGASWDIFLEKCKVNNLSVVEYETRDENWALWHALNASENKITTNNKQFKLPLIPSGEYDFHVDWGDGSSDLIKQWDAPTTTHTYSSHGLYKITINGVVKGWKFDDNNRLKYISTDRWSGLDITTPGSFINCVNWVGKTVANGTPTITTTSFDNMFERCYYLNGDNLNEWGSALKNVVSMNSTFDHCLKFNQRLERWDTQSVTSMSNMFNRCTSFNKYIGTWNVSNVANLNFMFNDCFNFSSRFYNWNVSSLTSANTFLYGTNVSDNDWSKSLINWSKLPVQQSVIIDANAARVSSSEMNTAVDILTGTYMWVINDETQ